MKDTKLPCSTGRKCRQSGLSLIELMIALVLGLLVIIALFNVYVGTARSSTFSSGLQTMQENGRFGTTTLRKYIRLAGYSPDGSMEPFEISNSSEKSITVRTVAERDCNAVSTATSGGIAVNTFAWDETANQITCSGISDPAIFTPLVEGVDGFRILYGIDTDDDDNAADKYVKYSELTAELAAGSSIAAIRFAMLVNSGVSIRRRDREETYIVLDDEVVKNDRIARHVFSTTVLLRNRAE